MLILSIFLGILFFVFLVVIHELGHFTAARKLGVKVLEFGIGIPPKIKKIWQDKSGTEYTLNAIPFGGFVSLKGDGSNEKDAQAKDGFMMAKLRKKVIILLGGIFMNFLFAWIVLTGVFTFGAKPFVIVPENIDIKSEVKQNLINNSLLITNYTSLSNKGFITKEKPVKIEGIISGSLVYGKLQTGDIIKSINGKNIKSSNFQKSLADNFGKEFDISYVRGTENKTLKLKCPKDNCTLGIVMQGPDLNIKMSFFQAGIESMKEIGLQVSATFKIMGEFGKNLITFNGSEVKKQAKGFSGPVGIVRIFYSIFSIFDWQKILILLAFISIALGAFNLLPIPALDGGRILGVIIQKIFKIPNKNYSKVEGYINGFFLTLIIILGIIIMIKDFITFWL